MSELITNGQRIIPIQDTAAAAGMVDGLTLDITVFIIGTVLMLMIGYLIFLHVFGQPVGVAKEAASGGCIIQHFNTPKSGIMKVAKVSGGAFQYKDIRDGTVAATPESVLNINGRQMVLTYAQLGLTLSPRLLAGISVLVHQGLKNLSELKTRYFTKVIPVTTVHNEMTDTDSQIQAGAPYWELRTDVTVLEGYNFNEFKILLKQSTEEQFVPLTIEAVPAFINRNVNADYTEKKLTIQRQLYAYDNPGSGVGQIMGIAIAIALVLFASTVIK